MAEIHPPPATGKRRFAPGRVVALVVIVTLAAGLGALRVASGADPMVAVPDGAEAGDLALEPCTYDTEDGSLAAECGTLVVPENRNAADSRLLALPVVRVRATGDDIADPIFRLEGGPGLSNLTFPQASWLTDRHDVVIVGYRGVDGSSVLNCPEVVVALRQSADLGSDRSHEDHARALAECHQRLAAEGTDLDGYSLPQRVDDLEAARVALGYDQINLLSESAGTRTAMIYSWRYPGSLRRSAMIAVNTPGHFLWDPELTDSQLDYYSELCAADERCRARTDDLSGTFATLASDVPDRWWGLPIKDGNARIAAMFGFFDTSSEAAPLHAPATIDTWLSAAEGDPSGLWLSSVMADLVFPESFVWGELAATGAMDAPAVDTFYANGGDPDSILEGEAADFLWAGGRITDAWPASPDHADYHEVVATEVNTLLIGGTIDFAVPPQVATDDLLPNLANGDQVILTDFGHTTDFFTYQTDAAKRLLTAFYNDGRIDNSHYDAQHVTFEVDGPTLPSMAKLLLGLLLGLPLMALLLLAWMARRVRHRGGFGSRSGAALQVLSPLVLGIGGWCLAVVVKLAVLPTTFIGSPFIAVPSIALAAGLGIHLASLRPDRVGETGYRRLVVVLAAGLVGAGLGFDPAAGLAAVLTAIIGAALAANTAVIILDAAGPWGQVASCCSSQLKIA